MGELSDNLEERYSEVEEYLRLIHAFEVAIQSGVPRIGETGPNITVKQQRILFSSVYLQLYNLIEATITNCLEEVGSQTSKDASCLPGKLNDQLRREWVRYTARTHVSMAPENRLNEALKMCDHLTSSGGITDFAIEKGGGGNWDDSAIEKITARIGCSFKASKPVRAGVKRKIRDEMGSMELIVNLRNKLAHGSISFSECGQYDTAGELEQLAKRVCSYLRELVATIEKYLSDSHYLHPNVRPAAVA